MSIVFHHIKHPLVMTHPHVQNSMKHLLLLLTLEMDKSLRMFSLGYIPFLLEPLLVL